MSTPTHKEIMDSIRNVAGTVTVLSYEESVNYYLRRAGILPEDAIETPDDFRAAAGRPEDV